MDLWEKLVATVAILAFAAVVWGLIVLLLRFLRFMNRWPRRGTKDIDRDDALNAFLSRSRRMLAWVVGITAGVAIITMWFH